MIAKRFAKVKTVKSILHTNSLDYLLYKRHVEDGNSFEYLADEFAVNPTVLATRFAVIEDKLREAFSE
jgi:hypothetical protein